MKAKNNKEKLYQLLDEIKQKVIDMSIDFDEYGMEPTTITLRSGLEIKKHWVDGILEKIEVGYKL